MLDPRSPLSLTIRAREALMMAGAGGATRARGGARQPSGFNNCDEGLALTLFVTHSRVRGADDGGRRRRDASYGVARDSTPVSTTAVSSMSSSLSRFSGWRSRSLSLGEGLTDSTGARDGTRAVGVMDRGRRRLLAF